MTVPSIEMVISEPCTVVEIWYAWFSATANGTVKAARTRLAMVELGGLIVRDVDAMVLPDEALSENLLGQSFLSRLKRFEYANGKMVLEQ